jgi:FkbM family methyltransferase
MSFPVKSLVKNVFRGLGYDVVKRGGASYPYVRSRSMLGVDFDFWIADEIGHLWYEEVQDNFGGEAGELQKLVSPGDRVLEIGCHHGFMTMFLANLVRDSGYICAVEAAPENALVAQAQVTLNDLGRSCIVINRAGSDSKGTVELVRGDNARNTNGQVVNGAGSDAPKVSVETVTGDELDRKYGPFTLLKIDVEGFEGKVLAGCREILKRRPKIALELHPAELGKFGAGIEDILRLLDIAEYEGTMIVRPDYQNVRPLNVETFQSDEPFNIFLQSKRK